MEEQEDNKVNRLLDEIQRRDINRYMEVCYETVVRYPDQLIEHTDSSLEEKLNSMDLMIEHFIEHDEFEKCGVLKELKLKIEEEHD